MGGGDIETLDSEFVGLQLVWVRGELAQDGAMAEDPSTRKANVS